jgi:predicted phosphodiesterase
MRTPSDPQRLLVAGDVHGNAGWLDVLCRQAAQVGCDAVLQLGDFGYWPHQPGGRRYLRRVTAYAERAGVVVYWIDGNHENHEALRALPPSADGFVDVADRCRYIPRALRWMWQGVRFGALGGAFSIDWRDRTPGTSWWPDEVTVAGDVARLGQEPLDILLTHEAPAGVPLAGARLPAEDQIRTDEVRALVADAVKATSPTLVLHGHWHRRHSYELSWPFEGDARLEWGHAQVEGLASDVERDARSWGILDLAPMRFISGEAVLEEGVG